MPEIVGGGRIRVIVRRLWPAVDYGAPIEGRPGFFVVEMTPSGASVVATGPNFYEPPGAFASDRDGTVHVLCLDTEKPESNSTVPEWQQRKILVARHGWARPGNASPIVFDSALPLHEANVHASMRLDDPIISGFDHGGPWLWSGGGSVMLPSSKVVGSIPAVLLSLRGPTPRKMVWSKTERLNQIIAFYGVGNEFGGLGIAWRPELSGTEISPFVIDGDRVDVAEPSPTRIERVSSSRLTASGDDRFLVFHPPGRPLHPAGSDTLSRGFVVPLGRLPSGLESWPSDTALAVNGNTIVFSRAGVKDPIWTTVYAYDERVKSARASCDDRACVVVAIVSRPQRSDVLRTYRFARPW